MKTWWTECGKCDYKTRKRFSVEIPDNIRDRKTVEKYFVKKHKVHLFPSRCEKHYEGENE